MTTTPRALLGDEKPDPTPTADQREQALAAGDTAELREQAAAEALSRWPDSALDHAQLDGYTFDSRHVYDMQRRAFAWGARWAVGRAALTPAPPADLAEIQARAHDRIKAIQEMRDARGSGAAEADRRYSAMQTASSLSANDVPALVAELAELRARPTLTAEEAHVALVWAGPNPEDWYDQRDAPLVAKLRAIAEGAGS